MKNKHQTHPRVDRLFHPFFSTPSPASPGHDPSGVRSGGRGDAGIGLQTLQAKQVIPPTPPKLRARGFCRAGRSLTVNHTGRGARCG